MYLKAIFVISLLLQARVSDLTRERENFEAETAEKASAYKEASDRAQHYQHLYEEIVALKDKTVDQCAHLQNDIETLKQQVMSDCWMFYRPHYA